MYVSCGGGVGEVSRGFVTEGDVCDKGHVLFTKSSFVCFCTTLAGSYTPDRVYTPLTTPPLHTPPGGLSVGFCPVRTIEIGPNLLEI